MAFKTPVLFIIFNRPEETRMVFDKIKILKPDKLFIAADGLRADNLDDTWNCKKTREIINEIECPCKTKTDFWDINLGCGKGPAAAISLLFQHEEQGIILEDECVPNNSYFFFCQELVDIYGVDA